MDWGAQHSGPKSRCQTSVALLHQWSRERDSVTPFDPRTEVFNSIWRGKQPSQETIYLQII